MGKMKRSRQKYHEKLKKVKNQEEEKLISDGIDKNIKPLQYSLSSQNIFDGIDINVDELQTAIKKEFDVESVFSGRGRQELKEAMKHMPKIEKRKLKRELFKKKLKVLQDLKVKAKDRRKRENAAVVGDLHPLLDALPELESLSKSVPKEDSVHKVKSMMKAKKRKKQSIKDIKALRTMIHSCYKAPNRAEAITDMVKKRLAYEFGVHT